MRFVLALVMMVAVSAANAGSYVDVNGTWASNWEDVTLHQEGSYIHGTYVCCGGGTIEGKIYDGRIIRYHWKQPNGGEGEGVWEIKSPERLEGTWGSGQSDDDGGRWDLVRKPSIATSYQRE
jgi:hypothetical protein